MHALTRPSFVRQQLFASRAREMRHAATASERLLWTVLSGKKTGTVFRRQVVVGRFIVDFLAPRERLIVEVDGGYHGERGRLDARRDRELARLGYRVLRLEAEMVLGQLPVAIVRIQDALRR